MTTIDRFSPAFRSTHLGASQVPAAIGVSPFRDPIELWQEYVLGKTSGLDSDAARLGHALEDGVAQIAAERLGVTALPMPTHTHALHPWLVATPDRLLSDGTLLQVKTTGLATVMRKRDVDEQWGEGGTDEVPVHVIAQCMTEMAVMRSNDIQVQVDRVAALIPGRGVDLFQVEWDESLWEVMLQRIGTFWTAVEDRREPAIDESDAWSKYLNERFPDHKPGLYVDATAPIAFIIGQYLNAMDHRDQMQRAMDMGENIMKAFIGHSGAEGIKYEGLRLPWRKKRAPDKVDVKGALRELRMLVGDAAFEEIMERHTEPGVGHTRAFGPIIGRKA